jgi:hypothetical protein
MRWRSFYTEFIPELEELGEKNLHWTHPEKVEPAEALQDKLEVILNSGNHKWYLNLMDAAEAKSRKKAREEFRDRYK